MFARRPLTSATFGAFESAEPAAAVSTVVCDALAPTPISEPTVASDWGDESDDIFGDLGPPPPCGPRLVRQQATDATVTREEKAAAFAAKVDTGGGGNALRTARLRPQGDSSRRQRGVWM